MSATTIVVNDVEPRRQYTATAAQTLFDFPIPFFETDDLTVWLTPAGQSSDDDADLLTLTTDYTVSGENTQDGGLVTLVAPASAGDIITIERIVDIERLADYQNSGDLLAETLNKEQDTEIFISQQLRQDINRGVKLSKTGTSQIITLEEPEPGKYLKVSSDAASLEMVDLLAIDIIDKALLIYKFDTVASMVADTTVAVGNIVETLGYFSKGDGGGNRYEIVTVGTGTDDGGSFIDLTTYQAKGLFPDGVNVKQFGAVGDYDTGTQTGTDNRLIFQAADNYMGTIGGGVLTVDDGDFLMGNSLNIRTSNLHLVVTPSATIRSNTTTSRGHCLAFASASSVAMTGYGIDPITNVSISGGGTVIAEDLSGGFNENAIAFVDCNNFRCEGMNIPFANRKAITAQINVQDGWIINNNIGETLNGAISVQGAFDIADAALPLENIYIHNNYIESAGERGIYVPGLESTIARDISIKGNIIRACGVVTPEPGIECRSISRPVVLDNYSSGGTNGVSFRDCLKIKADVNCDNVDNFGLHIFTFDNPDAQDFHIGEVRVGTSCGQDAMRVTSVKGGGYVEKIIVTSTDHESIYRVVGSTLTDKVVIPGGLVGTDGSVSRVNVTNDSFYPWLPISTVTGANGIATRFPDGSMICTREVEYDFTTATNVEFAMPDTFIGDVSGAIAFQNTATAARQNAFIGTCVMTSTTNWRVANNITQAELLMVKLTATGRWRTVAPWDSA